MQQRRKKETECGEKNQAKLVNDNAKKGNAELQPPTTAIDARETKGSEKVEAAPKAQAYPGSSSDQKSLQRRTKDTKNVKNWHAR